MSSFNIFYYTSRSFTDCCNALDTPAPYPRSDSEVGDLACRQCQCCIWPILIPIDLVTLPFRAVKHFVKKCSNKKCANSCNNKNDKKNHQK